jgi:dihydropteroate synthase
MAQIQVKQQAIEAQQQADAAKLQQMMAQHADETQIELLKQHQEAAIAVRQQNLQAFIDQQQMILEAHKHAAQLDSQQKIAKMRPGGALDR